MAVGTLLALGAGAAALKGGIEGAGTIAQSRQAFSASDRERLEELEEMERRGELGLTEAGREGIRAEATAQRGALLRDAESRGLREAAAAPVVTGRDLFLREQIAQQEARQMEEGIREVETEADIATQATQRAEIAGLEQARAMRRAGTVQGVTQILGGAAGAGAQALGTVAEMQYQTELEGIRQGAVKTDAEMLEEYRRATRSQQATPHSNRAPPRK